MKMTATEDFNRDTSTMADTARKISINRQAFNHHTLTKDYNIEWQDDMSIKEKATHCLWDAVSCPTGCFQESLLQIFPFIRIMRSYKWKRWLFMDVISGLSVSIIHIPQGMGFALLTAVPPIYGLYTSLFPGLIYFFFGTSRHLSMGSMALISMMVGAVVNREVSKLGLTVLESNNGTAVGNTTDTLHPDAQLTEAKIGIALSVSLLIGCFQFLLGLLRLGTVTKFMSMTFVGSFLAGAAFNIITSQLPPILGLILPAHPGIFKVPKTYYEIFTHITQTNLASMTAGLLCIIVLVVLKEVINVRFQDQMKVPIPAELIVVTVGILVSHYGRLHDTYGVKIVGPVAKGIEAPRVPPMINATSYITDALIIAVVSFVLSITMAKMMAKKHDYAIDVNQELFAYGLCHGVGAFFNCFAGAQAPPRTLVHDSVGGKTQVSSLVASLIILVVCYFFGGLFVSLPITVLAAVVIVSLLPLFRDFKQLPNLWRVSKYDFFVWIITFLTVVILDVTTGLAVGIGISNLSVLFHTCTASVGTRLSLDNTDIYYTEGDAQVKSVARWPGILVFKINAPLIFVNVEVFKMEVYKKSLRVNHKITQKLSVHANGLVKTKRSYDVSTEQNNNGTSNGTKAAVHDDVDTTHDQSTELHAVILDCSTMSYIDIVGLNALKEVRGELLRHEIRFCLAQVPRPTEMKMEIAGLIPPIDNDDGSSLPLTLYPTVHDAVTLLKR